MTASSRGRKAFISAFHRSIKQGTSKTPKVFLKRADYCLFSTSHCTYSPTYASASSQHSNISDQGPVSPKKIPIISTKTHDIHAGVILSRPPILTPTLHPFEKSFFFYQKRLNERLAIPFTRYFYFKKDTPANTDWKIKAEQRGGVPAKELGSYKAYGRDAWNDELLLKDKHMVEPEYINNQLVNDARVAVTEDGVVVHDEASRAEGVEPPRSRITEADSNNDTQRLDRLLDRTLYLIVRNKDDMKWGFPSGEILGKENLHQAAERVLAQSCGLNMNTWIVGHVPIAHHITSRPSTQPECQIPAKSKGIFYMKSRIMAGQANLNNNHFNLDSYCWLAKEEVAEMIPSALFSSVSNAMQKL